MGQEAVAEDIGHTRRSHITEVESVWSVEVHHLCLTWEVRRVQEIIVLKESLEILVKNLEQLPVIHGIQGTSALILGIRRVPPMPTLLHEFDLKLERHQPT